MLLQLCQIIHMLELCKSCFPYSMLLQSPLGDCEESIELGRDQVVTMP